MRRAGEDGAEIENRENDDFEDQRDAEHENRELHFAVAQDTEISAIMNTANQSHEMLTPKWVWTQALPK